jgi:TetR/AcrR family transcriptional repressor of nem operon
MSGRRSYEERTVVDAAMGVFWDRGLEWTAIGDLEDATGLGRSSLYLAFGSKRGIFDAALEGYLEGFIQPMLDPLEAAQAGLREAAGFFRALAILFRDPQAQRGDLMINTIAELAGRDPTFTGPAAQFANQLRAAFANALRGAADQGAMTSREAARRSELLTGAAMGVWMVVRADPGAAASTCRAVAAEITSWARSDTLAPALEG